MCDRPRTANRARANAADTSAGIQPAPAASFGRAFSITRSETSHPWRSNQRTCLKVASRSCWTASTIVSTLALNPVIVRLADPASTAIGRPSGPSTANILEWAMAAPFLFLSVRYQLKIRTSEREMNSAASAASRALRLSLPFTTQLRQRWVQTPGSEVAYLYFHDRRIPTARGSTPITIQFSDDRIPPMHHESEETSLVSLDNLIQQLTKKGCHHPDAVIGIPLASEEIHRRLALRAD